MQMNPCPFCHEPNRLGVVVKQLRTGEPGYVHYGAYARCKRCHARGSLVKLDTKFDVRNERVGRDGRRTLIDLAVDAWNTVAAQPRGTDRLPRNCDLFNNADEAIEAVDTHCEYAANGCIGCPAVGSYSRDDDCRIAWLFAPATEKEGGNK